MRISHYFFYYGPGAIVSKQNGRIWFIGIIPEPNKFFAPDELQKIEHETVLIQLVGSYISNLLSSNNPLQQRPISIKKLVPDRERKHCLDKSFFANGWKVCKRRKDHPGNAEVVFKSDNNTCPVCGKHQSVYAFYFIGVCSNGHLCQPNWWEIVHSTKPMRKPVRYVQTVPRQAIWNLRVQEHLYRITSYGVRIAMPN